MFVRRQLLDANQIRLFSLTLNRPHLWPTSSVSSSKTLEEAEPVQGTPIPPAYHLCYFTPAQLPGILGLDGTDASFNPDAPFTRRMWAGGSCHWPGADPNSIHQALLVVGDTVTEVTRVLSCEPKVIGKTGESMLVVGVEKEFRNGKDELCVLDRRNWVFRVALDPSKPAPLVPKPKELSQAELDESVKGKLWREYSRDEATLFRFSALTFNAHRIHYDKPWATEVEGHRNVVVHGPMNLIAMLDLWRDEASVFRGIGEGSAQDDAVVYYPQMIEYRATSPVYGREPYRVMMNKEAVDKKEAETRVVSNDGTVCMKGTVTDWSLSK
ncbi:mesaconyl-C4 CoA hydratase [Cladophialophora psammophila CBS 110553]|uniref:Mesaconyl-C4 CoA hydratase n=1 Tax=Cladophialophora psammophila CBS 110553 TaxID=1182543 RepID=W9XFM3_9EURO|nr:mesaconyl-C4 CoA hydratase [Cladophialophora psammophila CBS 110553]EXJ75741.1 mesaconyl-C4 CoA hydratase [Cladophialophora psammophila CBS 110553]